MATEFDIIIVKERYKYNLMNVPWCNIKRLHQGKEEYQKCMHNIN